MTKNRFRKSNGFKMSSSPLWDVEEEKKTAVYKKTSGFKMKSSPTKMYGKKAAPVKNYKKGYYGA